MLCDAGLHFGWAVEGAIGSNKKIDASYLSPHVNMASRLEAATKQFGTPILISDSIYSLLSDPTRRLCRLVDRVTVKGSAHPVRLYTFDVPDIASRGGTLPDDTAVWDQQASTEHFFSRLVPPSTTRAFRLLHKKAVELYLGGPDGCHANWVGAVVALRQCLEQRPEDGPSQAVLHVIQSSCQADGSAPAGWPGYRALTEK